MSYIGKGPSTVAFLTDTFSGNGSTTAFTMSVAPASTSAVLVAIAGVLQDPSTYSVVGTTLTFSAAPPSGTGNISARYLGIPASGVATTAYRTITEFTATASQTTFTPPSYTPGFINVFQNGVRLGAADYTATNGTTVVLATGAASGDLVTVESFLVSSVLNALPNAAGSVQQSNLASGVAGNGPAFSAYANTNQSITTVTFTKVTFGGETFDTNNNFASSTFTPTVAGYYQINAVTRNTVTSGSITNALVSIYKNGSVYKRGSENSSSVGNSQTVVSDIVYCNGTTDYIEIYAYIQGTTPYLEANGSTITSSFSGALVRAA